MNSFPRIFIPGIFALLLVPTAFDCAVAQELRIDAPDLVLEGVNFVLQVSVHDAEGRRDTAASGMLRLRGVSIGEDGTRDVRIDQGSFRSREAVVSASGQRQIAVRFHPAEAPDVDVQAPDAAVQAPDADVQAPDADVQAPDADVQAPDAASTDTTGSAVLPPYSDTTALDTSHELCSIPGVLSILPPLLAIVLALLLRQVIVSLFAGVWLGAVFVFGYNPFTGFLRVLDYYIINALADPDHMSIIAFSMLFGGMVGVISKSGGTLGIADLLMRIAKKPRGGQIATWLLGFTIFFDDYANSLIVGNTMRPITDRLRISREKLAFLVDATAAPVTAVLFISTWIGYEVGLIDAAMKQVDLGAKNAYAVFLDMLPYSFYPILTLAFGFLIASSDRDFGPMARAEKRARSSGKLFRDGAQLATDLTDSSAVLPDEHVRPRWWNAVLPILTVIFVALGGLWYTGTEAVAVAGGSDFSIGNIIGQADSYAALLWASLLSCVVAIVLAVGQRILRITEAMDAWFNGLKSMLLAMLILTLAWSIGEITAELHTADYLVQLLKGSLPPRWLPAATFVVAAVISFSTGTSWGTMGIMMPIVIPLAVVLGQDAGLAADPAYTVTLGTIASVLAGAVFGDHCSPISDTTILSSMASACDHIDHVRTQLPYALLVGAVAIFVGLIPSAYGFSPVFSHAIGLLLLAGILLWRGRRTSMN